MEDDVAEPQYGERRGDLAVVALAAVAELARDEDDQQREKGEIDRRRRNGADQRRERHRQPAGEPQRRERDQLAALQRQAAGPVGDRGQREAGDRRRAVAVDHLVDVPVERRIGGRQGQLAEIGRQPQRDREPGEQRRAEEERPEAIGEQRRAVVRLGARDWRHRRTPGRTGAARAPCRLAAANRRQSRRRGLTRRSRMESNGATLRFNKVGERLGWRRSLAP
jgi:hypothetical protein